MEFCAAQNIHHVSFTIHNFPITLIKTHQTGSPGVEMLIGRLLGNIKHVSRQPSRRFGDSYSKA